jgi:hypothetical protein
MNPSVAAGFAFTIRLLIPRDEAVMDASKAMSMAGLMKMILNNR